MIQALFQERGRKKFKQYCTLFALGQGPFLQILARIFTYLEYLSFLQCNAILENKENNFLMDLH